MKNSNEVIEYKTLIKIVIGVVIFFGLLYFVTMKYVAKDTPSNTIDNTKVDETTNTYNNEIIGTMFNIPEKEYYVIMYDSTSEMATVFNALQTAYLKSTTATKLYYVDLNLAYNKKYYSLETSNPQAKDLNDLKVKNGTLIKIKSGMITEYLEDYSEISKKLN